MACKTILVHLNNEHRVSRLIGAAVQLALPSNAHLTGLFVVLRVPFRSSIFPAISGVVVQSGLDTYRKSGERIRQAFEAAATGQPIVADWRPRDLTLFNLAIDSKLRGCDVVAVRVDDVAPNGYTLGRATVRQKKTGRPVRFVTQEEGASEWLECG